MKAKLTRDIIKRLDGNKYYSQEDFISDCKTYMKALQAGRVLYTVTHVSRSGMTRYIDVTSYEGTRKKGYFRNYYTMLSVLGYSFNQCNEIKVSGCGMDMLFATNYNIIQTFKNIGLVSKPKANRLSQMRVS